MKLRRSPRRISLRAAFIGAALLLGVVLIALVVAISRLYDPTPTAASVDKAGLRVWGVIEGPGTGKVPLFGRPMGVAIGKENRIYVTDATNNRVCVFNADGGFLFQFGSFGVAKPLPGAANTWRPGRLNYPVGIDTDPENGDVYVADFQNDQIQVFDADGKYLRVFPDPTMPVGRGSSGKGGKGIAVTDVCVVGDTVYATDKFQVVVFDRQGRFIRQFGMPGDAPGKLDHPNGIEADARGNIYVSDSNHARVTAFSEGGRLVWNVGEMPKGLSDTAARKLELPRGITLFGDRLAVVDAFKSEIVLLSLDGRLLGRYGSRGSVPGTFGFPNDIAVLRDRLVIADKDNERVQIVTLLGASAAEEGK